MNAIFSGVIFIASPIDFRSPIGYLLPPLFRLSAHDFARQFHKKCVHIGSRAEMRRLMARSLSLYQRRHSGGSPTRVVVHKSTPFKPEEVDGCFDAWPNKCGLELLQIQRDIAWRRPQESLRLEARQVDTNNQRWVFPKTESKNKQLSRVVYLTDTAMTISRALMTQYPEGDCFETPGARLGPTTQCSAHSDVQKHASARAYDDIRELTKYVSSI